MSSVHCNASRVLDEHGQPKPYSPLEPAQDVTFGAPFQLSGNKTMSRVYPKLVGGTDFELQLGAGSADPVGVSIFNGKDFDTGLELGDRRSLNVTLDEQKAGTMRALQQRDAAVAVPLPPALAGFAASMVAQGLCYRDRFQVLCDNPYKIETRASGDTERSPWVMV